MQDADVIIIGSGPAGVHAAQTLVDAGVSVLMIDGGKKGSVIDDEPSDSFTDIRRHNSEQWRLFLGKDFSAIPLDGLTGGLGGGQISGNRSYVADVKNSELPLEIKNGIVIQSLARGGLGAGWGAACAMLTHDELEVMGLPPDEMGHWYEVVGKRIGISGPQVHSWIHSPLPLDHHALSVAKYAERNSDSLRKNNIVTVQPHSAILTRDLGSRKASSLGDMEYWADPGKSVYRPQYTLEELLLSSNFRYEGNLIARRIESDANGTKVFCETIGQSSGIRSFAAKKIILACGAVNTARILLSSLGMKAIDVPFLGKPRAFSVCLNPHALGSQGIEKRISLCQYLLLDETPLHGLPRACAQLYSYRSLLLFRLVQSIPLPLPYALHVASMLAPALVFADIRFPVTQDAAASLRLDAIGKGDPVSIRFPSLSSDENAARTAAWKATRKALRAVHLFPLRNMTMPEGSTAHYAGTVPFAERGEYPLTVDRDGRCREFSGVSIVDASTFRALSPKPHTFTIMANACRVAEKVLGSLR